MPSKQILYVEDDSANQMLVKLFFKKEPFDLVPVDNPEDAMELMKSNSYDVVIVDLNLRREGDGAELIRDLRTLPGYENVPVFVFSGHDVHSFQDYGIEDMISRYFNKPVNKKDLIQALREVLEIEQNQT
ncbi:MAG: response regulator [Cyclonatronaceae bacterium]